MIFEFQSKVTQIKTKSKKRMYYRTIIPSVLNKALQLEEKNILEFIEENQFIEYIEGKKQFIIHTKKESDLDKKLNDLSKRFNRIIIYHKISYNKLQNNYRIAIPQEIIKNLKIKGGDYITWKFDSEKKDKLLTKTGTILEIEKNGLLIIEKKIKNKLENQ